MLSQGFLSALLMRSSNFCALTMMSHHSQQGYTLIEILCSLTIAGLVCLIVTKAIQSMSSTIASSNQLIEHEIAVLKTRTIVTSLLQAHERLRLAPLVTVTPGKNPQTLWGAPHPILRLTGTSRPRDDSDIITTTMVDPRYRGKIVQSIFHDSAVELTICEVSERPSPQESVKHLLLGTTSICTVRGELIADSGNCYRLVGTPADTILSSRRSCSRQAFLEYYPSPSDRSLFVDRSGTVRLLSHTGMNITENQPITRGLRNIVVARRFSSSGHLFYALTIKPSYAVPQQFLLPQRLSSQPLWNLVLQ